MDYCITNSHLSVSISTHGAELQSIKREGLDFEFLWQGDSTYWSGRAPILFPIVGGLKDKKYLLNDQEYSMPNHGIARINDFSLSHISSNSLVLVLESNDSTKKMYPFDFKLEVEYRLVDNTIFIDHIITNRSQKNMPFAFGLHPAFNRDDTLENTIVELEEDEELISKIDTQDGFIVFKEQHYGKQVLKFDNNSFDRDNTIIFDNLFSRQATMSFVNSPRCVKMKWNSDLPILAFWSKKDAPFLCIEPWCGWSDHFGDSIQELSAKKGMINLAPGDLKKISYSITVS